MMHKQLKFILIVNEWKHHEILPGSINRFSDKNVIKVEKVRMKPLQRKRESHHKRILFRKMKISHIRKKNIVIDSHVTSQI